MRRALSSRQGKTVNEFETEQLNAVSNDNIYLLTHFVVYDLIVVSLNGTPCNDIQSTQMETARVDGAICLPLTNENLCMPLLHHLFIF